MPRSKAPKKGYHDIQSTELPEPPYKLPSAVEKHYWRIGKLLMNKRRIEDTDIDLLVQASICSNLIELAIDDLDKHGLQVYDEKNRLVQNPSSMLLSRNQTLLLSMLRQMGMTPRTKSEVSTVQGDKITNVKLDI